MASFCYFVRCLYVFLCSFTNRKSKKFDKNNLNDKPKCFGVFETLMFPLWSCLSNRSLLLEGAILFLEGFFEFDHDCLIADLNQTTFSFDKDRLNHDITLHQAEFNLYFFIVVTRRVIQLQFFIAQLHFKLPLATWQLPSVSPVLIAIFIVLPS